MNAGLPIQKRVEGDEFDFVIVGGGTSGLVIAERLSRDPTVSVAVLEAGYDAESDTTLVPELYTTFIGTSIDWKFTTVPQTNAAGQVISLPRGKALGGTSTVNGMYFVRQVTPHAHIENSQLTLSVWRTRASQKEYDAWETLGNPGWNFASVNAHINAVEHFHVASVSPPNTPADALTFEALDNPWNHGHTGPIQVSYSNYWSIPEVVIPAYLKSLNKLGVPRNRHATSFELIPSLGTSGPLTQEDLARNATFAAQQWQTYVNESQGAYASVPGTTLAMIPLQSFISAATLESMLEELDAALGVYDGTPQETQIALQRGWLEDRTVPQVE
ncbi:hypothetical protein PHLCEN_2v7658 [Hermanssonia centrifuga]|uniref:Glucose-methanol-choline oxidoreductase N-terminal domain-containing protein n=1 Tax=Hermanssonia centrifuga TaxID=98765 RepID=A0A2R6NVW7_9APHY|nr:hypothetical protein PHLCEN_2v7658 [Hermanssonia centrifuga]